MKYKLEISSLVLLDVEEAILYYESKKAGLGEEFSKCLYAGLDSILIHPLHCAKKYREVRVKYIKKFPFGIHFIIESDIDMVIAFFHTKRDPSSWKRRIDPGY